ncbi:MAG: hypothetical protein GY874_18080 [Desulfobacteraceae bacterium]|nr:hypothetical protein [Desulfobacteraceae bacterium]
MKKKDSEKTVVINPRMMNVREAAEYLNFSVGTLRLRSAPKSKNPLPKGLRPKRINGAKLLWDRKQLDIYLDSL